MNSELIISALHNDEQAVLSRLVKQLHDRQPRVQIRSNYYDGKRALRSVGAVIPPQYARLGIVLGWSAKSVDLLARRCRVQSFVWPEGDLDQFGAAKVWSENKLRVQLGMARTSSLIHGPAFLINTRGDEDANEPKSLVHVRDANNATGEINERTWRLENLLSVTRWDKGEIADFVLYLDDLTVTVTRAEKTWNVSRSDHTLGVPADVLVYKQRPGRPFGTSRISRPVMSLHDQALREVMRLEGHMDVYSYPEFWMLGADPSIFKNADGTSKTSWQVMLGRIKGIPDDPDAPDNLARADVKQFQAASPQPHLSVLNAFAKMMARESSLPDTALAITDVSNPTSAESYDASQYELIAEAEGATDDWSPALERCFARALAIQSDLKSMPDEFEGIQVQWADPRYLSRSAQADAGMKQITAAPWLGETEVGLELLGLTDQQIARAQSDRRRAAGSDVLAALTAVAPAMDGEASSVIEDASAMKAKFDALGVAIRAGVDPDDAARRLGLTGIKFTGAVPVSLRLPESDASKLESQ